MGPLLCCCFFWNFLLVFRFTTFAGRGSKKRQIISLCATVCSPLNLPPLIVNFFYTAEFCAPACSLGFSRPSSRADGSTGLRKREKLAFGAAAYATGKSGRHQPFGKLGKFFLFYYPVFERVERRMMTASLPPTFRQGECSPARLKAGQSRRTAILSPANTFSGRVPSPPVRLRDRFFYNLGKLAGRVDCLSCLPVLYNGAGNRARVFFLPALKRFRQARFR